MGQAPGSVFEEKVAQSQTKVAQHNKSYFWAGALV